MDVISKMEASQRSSCDYVGLPWEVQQLKANQSLSHPVREGADSESFVIVPGFAWIKPTFAARYDELERRLMVSLDFQPLLINDYAPADTR